jgi:hypothetical protein
MPSSEVVASCPERHQVRCSTPSEYDSAVRYVIAALVSLLLASCTGDPVPVRYDRFDDQGRVQGKLLLGNQELLDGWIEMVAWRATEDECRFPNDCGLSVDALRSGNNWNPGRWIVVAPPIKGWVEPLPFDIVVRAGEVTSFEAKYRRLRTQPEWDEGLFGREDADFPIGLGFVFENIWRQVIHGKYVAVYAGSHPDPVSAESTSDGVVLVIVIEPKTRGHTFYPVEAPIPGPIRIQRVKGHLLTMASPSGESAVFDADARQFR